MSVGADHVGDRVRDSAHIPSVPALAGFLVRHDLPAQFTDMVFSATVYRHHLFSPWMIDVHVHGATVRADDAPGTLQRLADAIEDAVIGHNAIYHGRPRFGAVHAVVLEPTDEHHYRPGHVKVRRYYIAHRLADLADRARRVTGWVR
ncbi:hypothetical protein [Actinokineospora terrae]|uniref:hypothetical protein n=1 Tax=Actinokineospora terrae TaxID=155974 RepID=UPI000B857936|nr:hypothetical protein [Actinokineospora terrae]